MSSYVDQLVARDVPMAGAVRDPVRLRRYLQAFAANTAGTPVHKTVFDAAGIDRATAARFDALLQHLFVVELLPAYSSNRLNRLVRLPKRHLMDPALLRPLLGIDERAALRDGDVLGSLLDSFVTAQVGAELPLSSLDPRLFHVRDANGRQEVDLVVELADGRVIGIEIKADAAPGPESARHLVWLAQSLGSLRRGRGLPHRVTPDQAP